MQIPEPNSFGMLPTVIYLDRVPSCALGCGIEL